MFNYKPIPEETKQLIGWATYMFAHADKLWGGLVLKGRLTVQEKIDQELCYIERQKWESVVSDIKFAEIGR